LAQNLGRHVSDLRELQAEALRRQPQADLEIRSASRPDAVDDLEYDPCPVLEAAAIAVLAPVGCRREKLGEDISVSAVQFDAVEARPLGPLGTGDEVVAQLFHLGQAQGAGTGLLIVGRAHRSADQMLGRAFAGMIELRRGDRATRLDGAR
jgi:hypothetical protein